jgi:hypothetical protein
MTETFIELTEEDFDAQYPLVPNHINPSAGWNYADTGGCLFETSGHEFDFVRRYDPRKVWTLVDGDDGDMYLISGLHFVNRVGYLLSRDAIPADATVQVRLPMPADDGESPL